MAMNTETSTKLKDDLLAEYRHQQETETQASLFETEEGMTEERARRLEELTQHENVERYQDILNVHAAVNARNEHDQTFHSHDDTLEQSRIKYRDNDAPEDFGLGDRWGIGSGVANDKDDDYEAYRMAPELQRAASEHDHYEMKVKRSNFVNLFLDNYHADQYIVTHLYGAMQHLDDNDYADVDDFFETSAVNLSTTFAKRARRVEKTVTASRKMTPRETYIALIKGYCCTAVLLLPKTYQNGGLGMTSIFIAGSALISTYCVGKLVDAGLQTKLYSYSLIVERALGKKGRFGLDVMISLTQFCFSIAAIIFIINTFKITFDMLLVTETNPWIYGGVVICIFTPIAWVRNIAKFSFTFMLGNLLILLAVAYVTVYCFMVMDRQGGMGPDIKFINEESYLSALGMSVYTFEGIGIVMPVMQQSENPAAFKNCLICAMITLTTLYILFGSLGYMTWGSNPIEAYATAMLPADNVAVIIMNFLFSCNLIFGYPITILPANQIFGSWFCSKAPKGACKYWLKNFQRAVVVILAVVVSVTIAEKIDKFLGLVGAMLCAPLAMTIPSLVHLILIAKTTCEKVIDLTLIVSSLMLLTFCTMQSLTSW